MSSEFQPALGVIFKKETEAYSWAHSLDFALLVSHPNAIRERITPPSRFANALWDICFPSLPPGIYAHHTQLTTLEDIIRSREIFLHPLSNAIETSGELVSFAEHFGFRGFMQVDANGERPIDVYGRDLFAISLTDGPPKTVHWSRFGPIRLKLNIKPILQGAELRRVAYSDWNGHSEHPLVVLDRIARKHFNKPFNAWGTSRMGAYYMCCTYAEEAEIRLLIKRMEGGPDLPTATVGGQEVLRIPLNSPFPRVEINLSAIEVQTAAFVQPVQEVLEAFPRWNVNVSVYGEEDSP